MCSNYYESCTPARGFGLEQISQSRFIGTGIVVGTCLDIGDRLVMHDDEDESDSVGQRSNLSFEPTPLRAGGKRESSLSSPMTNSFEPNWAEYQRRVLN